MRLIETVTSDIELAGGICSPPLLLLHSLPKLKNEEGDGAEEEVRKREEWWATASWTF